MVGGELMAFSPFLLGRPSPMLPNQQAPLPNQNFYAPSTPGGSVPFGGGMPASPWGGQPFQPQPQAPPVYDPNVGANRGFATQFQPPPPATANPVGGLPNTGLNRGVPLRSLLGMQR